MKSNLLPIINMIKKIFKNTDIFASNIFQPELSEKIVLICLNLLTENQYSALKKTAYSFNESFFFSAPVFNQTIENSEKLKKKIKFKSYKDYSDSYLEEIMPEGATYSPSGLWGILFCDENFAIMGAKKEFMDIFKKNYPLYRENMAIFLQNQKFFFSKNWINDFMENFSKNFEISSEESKKYWRQALWQNIQNIAFVKNPARKWESLINRYFDELFLSADAEIHNGRNFWILNGYISSKEEKKLGLFNEKLSELWETYNPKDPEWKASWSQIVEMSKDILQKIDFDKLPES